MPLTISTTILTVLRGILNDANEATWTDAQLEDALRAERRSVSYRDPYVSSAGVLVRAGLSAPLRVPDSDAAASLLLREPGGESYQAAPGFRFWDDGAAPEVWVGGQVQDGGDYDVDYVNGRLTFDTAPQDWQAVNASFVYYRVWHAARSALLSGKTSGQVAVKVKQGDVEQQFSGVAEAVRAIDAVIASMSPASVPVRRRVY